MLTATVEYGVHGYVASTEIFEARTVTSLISLINDATGKFLDEIAASDEENGDLRAYTPEFGNGYPSLAGFCPEFGEDICGCLIGFTDEQQTEFEYNSVKHKALRAKTSLS